MKRTILQLLFLVVHAPIVVKGQTVWDIDMFTRLNPISSGRALSVGGTNVALGGSFTNASTNPAGINPFSEISISGGFSNIQGTETLNNFNNLPLTSNATQLNLNQVGLTGGWSGSHLSPWKRHTLSVGMNLLSDFNNLSKVTGTYTGSICNRFLSQLNSGTLSDEHKMLFLETGALYKVGNNYTNDFVAYPSAAIRHEQTTQETGNQSEYVVTYQTNYENKLLLGISLCLPIIDYHYQFDYSETDDKNGIRFFDKLNYIQKYQVTGTGSSVKLGAIYRPISAIRIGFAYHTPVWYHLGSNEQTQMTYTENGQTYTSQYPDNFTQDTFKYDLQTPSRVMGGIALFWREHALSVDAEWTDPSKSFYTFDTQNATSQSALNQRIQTTYQSQFKLRAGLQINLNKLYLRGGVSAQSSVYKGDSELYWHYSAGLAWRTSDGWLLEAGWLQQMKPVVGQYEPIWRATGNYSATRVDYTSLYGIGVLTMGIPLTKRRY